MGDKLTEHKYISGDEVSGNESRSFILFNKVIYQSILKKGKKVNSGPNAVKWPYLHCYLQKFCGGVCPLGPLGRFHLRQLLWVSLRKILHFQSHWKHWERWVSLDIYKVVGRSLLHLSKCFQLRKDVSN